MSIELKMPALSPTMEKGTLAKWLVKVGDWVKTGDLLAEVETDKATMELEAADEGRVTEIVVPEGADDVVVGTVIALLAGEAASAEAVQAVKAESIVIPLPQQPGGDETQAPVDAFGNKSEVSNATPLARRVAEVSGVSLATIKGSGPRGRIVRADLDPPPVRAVVEPSKTVSGPTLVAHEAPTPYPPPPDVPHEVAKLSNMRKAIARRLAESKQNVPHFYLTVRCQVDKFLKQRAELNAALASRGVKLSVNDMLIKAVALAMQAVPDVNVQYAGDELYRFRRVDISVAVAIEGGLITPVVRDADTLPLSAIAQQTRALVERARAGKLTPEEYQGGTATISNLAMFGIDEMIPVINPPQAFIVGVGASVEQPWKVGGGIGLATIMAITASFDHRAIDGATAAQFLNALRELVENPLQLLAT